MEDIEDMEEKEEKEWTEDTKDTEGIKGIEATEEIKEKRKRGRPRKSPVPAPVCETPVEESPEKKLEPLKTASERIAGMICSLSGEEELFVREPDGAPKRTLDTKTLKEFSSVIKEISSVICELNGIGRNEGGTGERILIEFEGSALECGE